MKKIAYMISAALLVAGFAGCESLRLGDAGLSKAPESSGATLDTLFASKKDADKVLVTAYWYLPYGIPSDFDSKMGGNMLESITDHFVSGKHTVTDGPNNLYYNGALGATIASDYDIGTEAYRFGSETDYKAIRYGWIFIENADRIPNATPAEVNRKKA